LLEAYELSCLAAETGQAAIEILSTSPEVDLVLMDIMMPEMDGYNTIRAIRALPQFRALPIFAVTAKAMKGDREKCFDAGASDYLAKPVEPEQLLSLMRVWLLR
jgi:CheY-like chemotaxis protein